MQHICWTMPMLRRAHVLIFCILLPLLSSGCVLRSGSQPATKARPASLARADHPITNKPITLSILPGQDRTDQSATNVVRQESTPDEVLVIPKQKPRRRTLPPLGATNAHRPLVPVWPSKSASLTYIVITLGLCSAAPFMLRRTDRRDVRTGR
jgi:hypothetical protein